MAQVRQEDEAFQSAMIACYAEYGLEGVRLIGGGSVGFLDLPTDPATQQVAEAAAADCNERVPLPARRQGPKLFDDEHYQRMLDTRSCIVAHGFEVPEAPSAQTWKDSDVATAWNPYGVLFDGPSGQPISMHDLSALMDACPQSGPNYYTWAPVPDAAD